MMTANKCRQNDVENLLVVHDSFSTDIVANEIMNECIRAAFIELYRDRNHLRGSDGIRYHLGADVDWC